MFCVLRWSSPNYFGKGNVIVMFRRGQVGEGRRGAGRRGEEAGRRGGSGRYERGGSGR